VIEQHIAVSARQRQSVAQLPHDPIAVRMCRAVEVQNSASAAFDDEEAVERAKPECRNSEEVGCRDHLAVVVEERKPLFRFAFVASALQPLEVARNRRFGNLESKPEQFAMNARRAPCWIIDLHKSDQFTNFFIYLRSAGLPRSPTPEQSKTSTMSRHHGFGLHDDERVGPAAPNPSKRNPESPIKTLQPSTRLLPLVYGELLSKSGRLQRETMPRHNETPKVECYRQDEIKHQFDRRRLNPVPAESTSRKPSNSHILSVDGILMTYSLWSGSEAPVPPWEWRAFYSSRNAGSIN
jgi:hypothetical protein